MHSDPSIYVWVKDDVRLIVPIFVDDLMVASKSPECISEFKADLAKHFKLRDLGPTSFLLGVAIDRDRSKRTLSLSQRQYILDLLQRFNFSDCSPVATPMNLGL